jgi:hypothetical protein
MRTPLCNLAVSVLPLLATSSFADGIRTDWVHATFGASVGVEGLEPLPGAEGDRLLVTGYLQANGYWQVLAPGRGALPYRTEQLFAAPWLSLAGLRVGDVAGDSAAEIVVAYRQGRVDLYDAESFLPVGSFATPTIPDGLELADADGAPPAEIFVTTSQALRIYRGDGVLLASTPLQQGRTVAVGQMDFDPEVEIATTDGRVLEGLALTEQWRYSTCCYRWVDTVDLDRDGRHELIASYWDVLDAFEVEQQSLRWSLPVGLGPFGRVLFDDLDSDGTLDLATRGVGASSGLVCRRAEDLTLVWGGVPSGAPVGIAMARWENGDDPLLLTGVGADSSGPDHLVAYRAKSGEFRWRSLDSLGFVGPVLGDFDGDGRIDAVAVSRGEGSLNEPGAVLVFDTESGEVTRVEALPAPLFGNAWSVEGVDLEGYGVSTLLVGGDDRYSNTLLAALDFVPGGGLRVRWKGEARHPGAGFGSLRLVDLDLNGDPEIVAASSAQFSNGESALFAFDAATGIEWARGPLGTNAVSLTDADLDGDGRPEILAVGDGGPLHAVDLEAGIEEHVWPGSFRALSRRGDEIWIGDYQGRLVRARPVGGTLAFDPPITVSTRPIDALLATADGLWVATFGDVLFVRDGVVLARSAHLGRPFGGNLVSLPGEPGTVLGSGQIAVARLRRVPSPPPTGQRWQRGQ